MIKVEVVESKILVYHIDTDDEGEAIDRVHQKYVNKDECKVEPTQVGSAHYIRSIKKLDVPKPNI